MSNDQITKISLEQIKNKVIIISGKGGVGKSTVSVNIAVGLLMEGYKVGILDVDIHGPTVAKMLKIEDKKLEANHREKKLLPVKVLENLYVVTIANITDSPDKPIIWRGPMKTGVIKQFLQDIKWPELDYLIIDSPPGTGDEPLSVLQLLDEVTGSVVVATPQDVAMLNVRKSINFSKMLDIPVIGIVENMSGLKCPHCGEEIDLFKKNGIDKTAEEFGINILGKVPIDTDIVHSTDDGKPYVYNYGKNEGAVLFREIAGEVAQFAEKNKKK